MSVDELMKQYSGAYDSDFEAELADMSCGDDSTPDDTEDEEEEEDESSEGMSCSWSCSSSCSPVVGVRLVTRNFAVQLILLFSGIAPCWWFFPFPFSSSSVFLRSLLRQSSHLSCGLPCFLR